MAEYLRNSKCLQRIGWTGIYIHHCSSVRRNALVFACISRKYSLKELDIDFPLVRGPSNLALESMLKHTQSLRSLLVCPDGVLKDIAVAAAASD
jgi:hypothetical protein